MSKSGKGAQFSKHLNAYGIEASPIPKLILDEEEIRSGLKIIEGIKNPIAVSYNTSSNLSNYGDVYKSFKKEDVSYICQFLSKRGFTPINLGLSSNSYKVDGIVDILDLGIREVASCFYHIKRMISNESGPLYLMLAVEGRVLNFIPPHCPTWFQYDRYVYGDFEWDSEEEKRICYADLRNIRELDVKFNFLG